LLQEFHYALVLVADGIIAVHLVPGVRIHQIVVEQSVGLHGSWFGMMIWGRAIVEKRSDQI
jgi:hypothetical protein